MKKTFLLTAIGMFLFIVVGACNKGREALPPTTNIPDNVKVVIYVTDSGDITILDTKGEKLEPCMLPKPDADKKTIGESTDPKEINEKETAEKEITEEETSDVDWKVCQGLEKGSAVTNIQMLTIMKTNKKHCITIGTNSDGTPLQYCWRD
jgi:hypothetical protein